MYRFCRFGGIGESTTCVVSTEGGGSIPTAPTKLFHSSEFVFAFDNKIGFDNN
jgi:hypothetical protein